MESRTPREETFVLSHRGNSHRVTVEMRHKGRIMRVFAPGEQNNVLTGLSKFEDSRKAAKSVIDTNPKLRSQGAAQ